MDAARSGSAALGGMNDPEERALLYVQQYLRELGFTQTLAVFEKECGLLYDESKYEQGSELLQLVYGQMESEVAAGPPADAPGRARVEEERALLRRGAGDLPTAPAAAITGAHGSNILAVRIWPGRDRLATGSADGTVKLLRFDGSEVWSMPVASGGALCLDWSPFITSAAASSSGAAGEGAGGAPPARAGGEGPGWRRALLVVGSMDGSVTVLDADTGGALASARPHSKYVVRAALDPWGGAAIATASFDQSCCLLRLAEGEAGALRLEVVRQMPHSAAVQDVAFLPPAAAGGSRAEAAGGGDGGSGANAGAGGASRVLVAVRESGCIWCIDAESGEELARPPLACHDDHHLALSPMRLALSPCGSYLLVALDGPRLLVLRTSDWSRARALYGLHVAQFHNHAVAWHHDSAYVYASAEGAAVHIYHVGTGKVAARLEGVHRINVRDLDVDASRNLLATCSFDKSVRVFRHAGGT